DHIHSTERNEGGRASRLCSMTRRAPYHRQIFVASDTARSESGVKSVGQSTVRMAMRGLLSSLDRARCGPATGRRKAFGFRGPGTGNAQFARSSMHPVAVPAPVGRSERL